MSTEMNAYDEKSVKKKRSNVSLKIIIFLFLLLAGTLGGFYFYYRNTQAKIIECDEKFQEIKNLQSEKERCSIVLSQESGNFNDYEYCRQLLQVFPQ